MNNCASSNRHAVKSKVKRCSVEKSCRKNKITTHEPISLDDFKFFTASVIEELKVATENMLACMREEMIKLVSAEAASKRKRRKVARVKEKVEKLKLSAKKSIYSSSPYLTSPTVVSKPQVENPKLVSSFKVTHKTGIDLERAKLLLGASTRRGYFSSMQQVEQFRSFPQHSSQNLNYFDQRSTPILNMGTGFPVQFHQGSGNGFKTPSKGPGNLPGENNFLGLKMSGGAIRFSGGSCSLSQNFISSSFRGQANYKSGGGVMEFGIGIPN